MRNSTSGTTPKANTVQDESNNVSNNAEKTSAKKLKQARLPFKVIAPGTSPLGTKAASTTTPTIQEKDKDAIKIVNNSTDSRKRKLSYDEAEDEESVKVVGAAGADDDDDDNVSKENMEILTAASKKKKLSAVENNTTEVVSLLDDDDNGDENVVDHENKHDLDESHKEAANSSIVSIGGKKETCLKTPKANAKDNKQRKGAGTPSNTSSAQKDKNSGSASKLQIKLPLSAGKKKRRKSKLHQLSFNNSTAGAEGSHNNSAQELSSDDIEEIAVELNPLKRKKLNTTDDEDGECNKTVETKSADQEKEEPIETIALDSESEAEEEEEENGNKTKINKKEKANEEKTSKKTGQHIKKDDIKSKEIASPKTTKKSTEKPKSSEDDADDDVVEDVENVNVSKSSEEHEEAGKHVEEDDKEELDESVLTDHDQDNEADDETEKETSKLANISSDISDSSKTSKPNKTTEAQKNDKNTNSSTNLSTSSASSKNLTPKQMKLMEQRRKAREEKERKLQEEKLKKQQEKEEKELARKREREEKEEQKRKEREEKEEQKRKEREEKERKRLAEVEAKNEEKRKKNEAKEEELRKKEEERKRKEQEKEEAELKKKKAAQAFTKFFVAKTPTNAHLKNEEDSNTGDDAKPLAFRPFQVKGDMKLAPVCRKIFTPEEKARLEDFLGCKANDEDDDNEEIVRRKPLTKSQLYLAELRSGKILPGKWRRPSTDSKDDVILVEDELERVGQEIVEDTPAYIREEMRVKFYKFHDNRRPPYYGTWRKKSTVVKPRRPFAQDKKFFDYEVDSDDEWEEEEPGESLEDGSDDDKEKESEDDDYEVDNEWFVPHGHLSDEELQNEDEFGMGDDNTREAQKAKLQILQQEFAQEMKKKTEKIKPRLIGCIWADINGNQPAECANILWDSLQKKAMILTEPPLLEEPEPDRSGEPGSPTSAVNGNNDKPNTDKLKPITLSDNMIKDLTRLVHGNNHSKNFLINEYIAYVEKTEESVKNGDLRKPLKSVIRDKIDEMAEWQAVDATASSVQDMEQQGTEDAVTESTKKKKKGKKRLCWVVKQEVLDKLDLPLELQNNWEYTLPPKFVKADKEVKPDDSTATNENTTAAATAEESAKIKQSTAAATSQITKFTKVLTPAEKAAKLQNTPASKNSTPNEKSSTETKSNTVNNTTPVSSSASKEKKRVPLLMSVGRGQQIPTPAKNKLISQFLQQKNKDNEMKSSSPTTSRSKTVTSPEVEDDDVVILD